jgi:hypothetical protein
VIEGDTEISILGTYQSESKENIHIHSGIWHIPCPGNGFALNLYSIQDNFQGIKPVTKPSKLPIYFFDFGSD